MPFIISQRNKISKFHFSENKDYNISENKEYPELSVYDGVDNCSWNGGRVNCLLNTQFDYNVFKAYQALKIPVFLTFSSPFIDIADKRGNELLEIIANQKIRNGVIIVNETLRQFIRKKYPELIIIYSITGHSNNYKDFDITLENRYDLIVPRFENVFNPEFLKVCDTSKYEIMLNDTCSYGCKMWNTHFKAIAEANLKDIGIQEARKIQECWIPGFDYITDSQCECMDLSKDAILKAKSLGYKHFKISGRENKPEELLSDLNKYFERL